MDCDTAVVISSCDKYKDAWAVLKYVHNKYWADCPFPVYFITNSLDSPFGETIKVGDMPWSDCMKAALSQIDKKTIIFLIEDYWFTQQVDTHGLQDLCAYLRTYGMGHIRLYTSTTSQSIQRRNFNSLLDILSTDESYRCSMNAGIWDRQTFLDLLVPNQTIWDSEHHMTNKSRELLFCTVRKMKYFVYDVDKNMINRGVWTKDAYEYLEHEGCSITK